jgi:hypothetical protein
MILKNLGTRLPDGELNIQDRPELLMRIPLNDYLAYKVRRSGAISVI